MESGTTLIAPRDLTAAELTAAADLEIGPEYVLVFSPPCLYSSLRDRITQDGAWELLSLTDYEAGNPPREDWVLNAPQRTPEDALRTWTEQKLRFLVALQYDTCETTLPGRRARTRETPLYWVRRNT